MPQIHSELGMTIRLNTNFEAALKRTIEALKVEGFGVLTEIDVQETMKKKLNIDFRPYKILGACNPSLAYQALTVAPEVGLLLPCNVTVVYIEDNLTAVSLVSPLSLLGFVNRSELGAIADEANDRLNRVGAALTSIP